MNIASVANLVLAFKSSKTESFVSRPEIKRVLAIFLPCLVYVAVMQWLGLYVASVIFIAVFMRWQGKFSLFKSVLTSVIVVAVLFGVAILAIHNQYEKLPASAKADYI